MVENRLCKICNKNAKYHDYNMTEDSQFVDCEYCGKYFLLYSFETDIYPDKSNFYKVSSWIREQNDEFNRNPNIDEKTFDKILEMRDKKIQEKFDLMMLHLSEYKNQQIPQKLHVRSWARDSNEFHKLFTRAIDNKLINGNTYMGVEVGFSDFTFDGLVYIENLNEPNKSSKNIFIAFNFDNELPEIFNTYVKEAIEELGFNYTIVTQNTTTHDKAISDEIIAKLKSSRIVIADFTNHRNSVYFEAGFAMGMKIPIIWTCQEGHEDDLSFDTRQYPHLVWKDGEDLKKQITDRIKVIL